MSIFRTHSLVHIGELIGKKPCNKCANSRTSATAHWVEDKETLQAVTGLSRSAKCFCNRLCMLWAISVMTNSPKTVSHFRLITNYFQNPTHPLSSGLRQKCSRQGYGKCFLLLLPPYPQGQPVLHNTIKIIVITLARTGELWLSFRISKNACIDSS